MGCPLTTLLSDLVDCKLTRRMSSMRDIFRRLGSDDVPAFQATLAMSAMHLSALYGHPETVESITHKGRLLRMLNHKLQERPNQTDTSAIICTFTLTAAEVRITFVTAWMTRAGHVER